MTSIPTLNTERLVMRAPGPQDFEAYVEFRMSDRAVGVGGPFTRSQAFDHMCELLGHWPMRGFGRWMVADKTTDQPLGIVGLMYPESWPEPEIAWSVFADGEGRGIAYEAAMESRRYAYDVLGWDTVISCIVPENTRSIALAKRMGAVQETSFQHEELGELDIWRHLSREVLQ